MPGTCSTIGSGGMHGIARRLRRLRCSFRLLPLRTQGQFINRGIIAGFGAPVNMTHGPEAVCVAEAKTEARTLSSSLASAILLSLRRSPSGLRIRIDSSPNVASLLRPGTVRTRCVAELMPCAVRVHWWTLSERWCQCSADSLLQGEHAS